MPKSFIAMAGLAEAAIEEYEFICTITLFLVVACMVVAWKRSSNFWAMTSVAMISFGSILLQPWQAWFQHAEQGLDDPDVQFNTERLQFFAVWWLSVAIAASLTLVANWRSNSRRSTERV